MIKQRVLAEKT